MDYTVKSVVVNAAKTAPWHRDVKLDVVLLDANKKEKKARLEYEEGTGYTSKNRLTVDKPYTFGDDDAKITKLSDVAGLKDRAMMVVHNHHRSLVSSAREVADFVSGKFNHEITNPLTYDRKEKMDEINLHITRATFYGLEIEGDLRYHYNAEEKKLNFNSSYNSWLGVKKHPQFTSGLRLPKEKLVEVEKLAQVLVENYITTAEYQSKLVAYRIAQEEEHLKRHEQDVVQAQNQMTEARSKIKAATTLLETLRAEQAGMKKKGGKR